MDNIEFSHKRSLILIIMKHDQLLAFEAIVTTGTFRGAAERLNKSQSAISHTIRQLEVELELTLLSCDGYRPRLTPEGQVFFARPSACRMGTLSTDTHLPRRLRGVDH